MSDDAEPDVDDTDVDVVTDYQKRLLIALRSFRKSLQAEHGRDTIVRVALGGRKNGKYTALVILNGQNHGVELPERTKVQLEGRRKNTTTVSLPVKSMLIARSES